MKDEEATSGHGFNQVGKVKIYIVSKDAESIHYAYKTCFCSILVLVKSITAVLNL